MARVKFGAMMVDARGKLGGHVFTKARSGATIRTKVTPVNGQTVAQGIARSRLGSLSQAWSGTLTEAQRLAWNNLAASTGKTNIFGDTYFPSGKNLFVALNTNVLLAGGSIILDAPSYVEQPALLEAEASVEVNNTQINLYFDYAGVLSNSVCVIMASKPSSAGVFNFSGKHSVIFTTPANTQPDAEDLWKAYIAKYGAPLVGQKISFQMFTVNTVTGQSSPKSSFTSIAYNA